jgi:hypothetical protein
MSEQGVAPEIPEDLREWYWAINSDNPAICWRHETAILNEKAKAFIERITALTLERDTLKAENASLREWEEMVKQLDKARLPCGHNARYGHTEDGGKHGVCMICKVERLSAPVSDEELLAVIPKLSRYVSERLLITRWKDGIDVEEPNGNARELVNSIIAARASTPPAHPINEDEQRRKDAGWNDRPKARCVCGEMIAWYSGEWLHVDSRSKSCADVRLASPAHFLVGMPPAEPEWRKEKP